MPKRIYFQPTYTTGAGSLFNTTPEMQQKSSNEIYWADFPDDMSDEEIKRTLDNSEYFREHAGSQFLQGARRGADQMIHAAGTVAEITGRATGIDKLEETGRYIREGAAEVMRLGEESKDTDLQKSIYQVFQEQGTVEGLKAIVSPRRLSGFIGEMTPGMLATMGAGTAVGLGAKALGATGKVLHAARAVGGGAVNIPLESAPSYEESLQKNLEKFNGDEALAEEQATRDFLESAAYTGAFNIPFLSQLFKGMPKEGKSMLWEAVKTGAANAFGEYGEELGQAFAVDGVEGVKQTAPHALDVILPSFLMGTGGGAIQHKLDVEGEKANKARARMKATQDQAFDMVDKLESRLETINADKPQTLETPPKQETAQELAERTGKELVENATPEQINEALRETASEDDQIAQRVEEEKKLATEGAPDKDELYNRAVNLVAANQSATTRDLSNKLGTGLLETTRILNKMEEEALIGKKRSDGTRDVFVTPGMVELGLAGEVTAETEWQTLYQAAEKSDSKSSSASIADIDYALKHGWEKLDELYPNVPFTEREVLQLMRAFNLRGDSAKAAVAAYALAFAKSAQELGMTAEQLKEKTLVGFFKKGDRIPSELKGTKASVLGQHSAVEQQGFYSNLLKGIMENSAREYDQKLLMNLAAKYSNFDELQDLDFQTFVQGKDKHTKQEVIDFLMDKTIDIDVKVLRRDQGTTLHDVNQRWGREYTSDLARQPDSDYIEVVIGSNELTPYEDDVHFGGVAFGQAQPKRQTFGWGRVSIAPAFDGTGEVHANIEELQANRAQAAEKYGTQDRKDAFIEKTRRKMDAAVEAIDKKVSGFKEFFAQYTSLSKNRELDRLRVYGTREAEILVDEFLDEPANLSKPLTIEEREELYKFMYQYTKAYGTFLSSSSRAPDTTIMESTWHTFILKSVIKTLAKENEARIGRGEKPITKLTILGEGVQVRDRGAGEGAGHRYRVTLKNSLGKALKHLGINKKVESVERLPLSKPIPAGVTIDVPSPNARSSVRKIFSNLQYNLKIPVENEEQINDNRDEFISTASFALLLESLSDFMDSYDAFQDDKYDSLHNSISKMLTSIQKAPSFTELGIQTLSELFFSERKLNVIAPRLSSVMSGLNIKLSDFLADAIISGRGNLHFDISQHDEITNAVVEGVFDHFKKNFELWSEGGPGLRVRHRPKPRSSKYTDALVVELDTNDFASALEPTRLYQGKKPRGEIRYNNARTRFLFRGLNSPNVSTALHELAHFVPLTADYLRLELKGWKSYADRLKVAVKGLFGKEKDVKDWTREDHEKFARGFEAYMLTGISPVPELAPLYQLAKQELSRVYQSVKEISPELVNQDNRAIYDQLFDLDTPAQIFSNLVTGTRQVVADIDKELEEAREAGIGVLSQSAKKRDKRKRIRGRHGSINFSKMEFSRDAEKYIAELVDLDLEEDPMNWEEVISRAAEVDADNAIQKALTNQALLPEEALAIRLAAMEHMQGMDKILKMKPSAKTRKAWENHTEAIQKAMRRGARRAGQHLHTYKLVVGMEEMFEAMEQLGDTLSPEQAKLVVRAVEEGSYEKVKAATDLMKLVSGDLPTRQRYNILLTGLFYNSLLSAPRTHGWNIKGNSLFYLYAIPHSIARAGVDAFIAKATGRTREHFAGDGWRYTKALFGGVFGKDSVARKAAKDMLFTGHSEDFYTRFDQEIGENITRLFETAYETTFPRMSKVLKPGLVNAPSRGLMAMDLFFKAVVSQAEMENVSKWHKSLNDQVTSGKLSLQQYQGAMLRFIETENLANARVGLKKRIRTSKIGKGKNKKDVTSNEWLEELFRLAMNNRAQRMAEMFTFQDAPGPFTRAMVAARGKIPAAKFFVPFITTVSNLIKRSSEMLPVVGYALARRHGFSHTEALTKQIEGAMLAAYVWHKVAQGDITGGPPDDPTEREVFYKDKLPYSIRVGGQWISYRYYEPFGTTMAVVADLAQEWDQMLRNEQETLRDPRSAEEKFTHLARVAGGTLLNNHFVSQIYAFAESEPSLSYSGARLASGFIPYSSFWRSINHSYEVSSQGAVNLEERTFLDVFSQSLPPGFYQLVREEANLGKDLGIKRDAFGEPTQLITSLPQIWLPYKMQQSKLDHIETELAAVDAYPGPPGRVVTFQKEGYRLPDQAYYEYVLNAGVAMKEVAGRIVQRPGYINLNQRAKKDLLRNAMEQARTRELNKVKARLAREGWFRQERRARESLGVRDKFRR